MASYIVFLSFSIIFLISTLKTVTLDENVSGYILDLTETGSNFLREFEASILDFIDKKNIKEKTTFNVTFTVLFPNDTRIDAIKDIVDLFNRTFTEKLLEFRLVGDHKIITEWSILKEIVFKMYLSRKIADDPTIKIKISSLDESEIVEELKKYLICDPENILDQNIIFKTPLNITEEFGKKIGRIMLNYAKNCIKDTETINVISTQCLNSKDEGETKLFIQITRKPKIEENMKNWNEPSTNYKGDFLYKKINNKERIIDDVTVSMNKLKKTYICCPQILVPIRFYSNYTEREFRCKFQEIYAKIRLYINELEKHIDSMSLDNYYENGEFGVTLYFSSFRQSAIFRLPEFFSLVSNHRVSLISVDNFSEKVWQIYYYKYYTVKKVPNDSKLYLILPFEVAGKNETLESEIVKEMRSFGAECAYKNYEKDDETGQDILLIYVYLTYHE